MAKKKSSRKKRSRSMPAPIVILVLALVLVALVYFMKGGYIGVQNKMGSLENRINPVLSRFGLNDKNISKSGTDEEKLGDKSYIHTYLEYVASKNLSLKKFDAALRASLRSSEFRVTKSNVFVGKGFESAVFFVNSGKMEVLTLRISKSVLVPTPPAPKVKAPEVQVQPKAAEIVKPSAPVEIAKPMPAPAPAPIPIVKKPRGPRIAIVLDDFGYNKNNIPTLFSIKQPVTVSILPNLKYSKEVEKLAHGRGLEVMLHLPMQSLHSELKEEYNTIKPGLSRKEILARLDYQLANFRSLRGVNNHMGSEATEDRMVMATIMGKLKEKNLYFLDSYTSAKSVCKDVAIAMHERFARRDVFLDNSDDIEYIKNQLTQTKKIAQKKGYAIAIGHDRKNTIKALSEVMPKFEEDGVEFVSLSELVN
jgi:polysaccharide deacetylase 2 family uncharacterized protein YibQ